MALPTSPSVVVLENDVSVFAPNVDSSVVGVVGFATKGPTNKATLITSPENLIRRFGKPDSAIPGQGLEGAIEILEATNQMYFVRAANTSAAEASALVQSVRVLLSKLVVSLLSLFHRSTTQFMIMRALSKRVRLFP